MDLTKTIDAVLSARSYFDLPSRRIIRSSFFDKPLRSYGIVAYCSETQRWLLVQRQHNPEYIITLRGSYRISDIPRLVMGYSSNEARQIYELTNSQEPRHPTTLRPTSIWGSTRGLSIAFSSLFRRTISESESDLLYGAARFDEALPLFRTALESLRKDDISIPTKPEKDTEWLWPKGRMHTIIPLGALPHNPGSRRNWPKRLVGGQASLHRSKGRETPFRCALREFAEETGIYLNPRPPTDEKQPYLVSTKPLVESFRGSNGRVYETTCWIYVFPVEITPPPLPNQDIPGEIGNRKWVTQEEARLMLSENKYAMLQSAQQVIERNMNKLPILTVSPQPRPTHISRQEEDEAAGWELVRRSRGRRTKR